MLLLGLAPLTKWMGDSTLSIGSSIPLYNGLMKTSYISNAVDLLLLLMGAFLMSPYQYINKKATTTANFPQVWASLLTKNQLLANKKHLIPMTLNSINEEINEGARYAGEGAQQSDYNDEYQYVQRNEQNEYILLSLCTLLGSVILVGSNDMLPLLLGIELQSYSLYIIASTSHFSNDYGSLTIGRFSPFKNKSIHEPSEAAGLKYYLLGALASALILLGMAILYAATGSTNFISISDTFVLNGYIETDNSLLYLGPHSNTSEGRVTDTLPTTTSFPLASLLGLLLIGIGIIWKFAGAPLHNWAIDVYDALPTFKAAWLAIIPKIALLAIMGDLVLLQGPLSLFSGYFVDEENASIKGSIPDSGAVNIGNIVEWDWALKATNGGIQLILLVSILSMIIGAVGALTQPLIKRLLAYSSIGQLGFILLGMSIEHIGAMAPWTVFYLSQYSITNAGIWLCLTVTPLFNSEIGSASVMGVPASLQNGHNSLKIPNLKINGEVRSITELQGIHESNIFIALAFTVFMFSLAGIPPMVGFFAKLEIISASLNSGYIFISVIAILSSLISASYYLRVVRSIFFSNYKSTKTNSLGTVNFYEKEYPNTIETSTDWATGYPGSADVNIGLKNINITYTTALIISLITLIVVLFLLQANVIFIWCKLIASA